MGRDITVNSPLLYMPVQRRYERGDSAGSCMNRAKQQAADCKPSVGRLASPEISA